jgi:hypothetical protein
MAGGERSVKQGNWHATLPLLQLGIHRQADLAVSWNLYDRARIGILGKAQRGASRWNLTRSFTKQPLQPMLAPVVRAPIQVFVTQYANHYDILGQAANCRFLLPYCLAEKCVHISVCARRAKKLKGLPPN